MVVPTLSTGGTDSRCYRFRGVPAYGFLPFVIPDGDTSRLHDVDERVQVDALRRGVRLLFEVARDLAEKR